MIRPYLPRRGYGFVYPIVIFILVVIVGLGVAGFALKGTGNDRIVTIHVTDKERVCSDGNSDCKYLIYADEGTFKNVDSILNWKFNSSDVYGEIKRDHTYKVKVEGFRAGVLSEYPNIIDVLEEVNE